MIYEPADDSYILAEAVSKCCNNKSVLDLGAGSGIISSSALKANAKSQLASDISFEAVKYLKSLGMKAVQSNLLDKIKGKFDIIAFNPPYLPKDYREDKVSSLITTGGKKGDEITLDFLKSAPSYLSPNGIILLLLSSLTPKKRIISLMKDLKLKSEVVASKKIFFEKLEVWKIFKA